MATTISEFIFHWTLFFTSISRWLLLRNFTVISPTLASLEAEPVKNLPARHKTWVRILGQDDPLAKGMETYSSILAWRIPWTERSLAGYTVHGIAKSWTQLSNWTTTLVIRLGVQNYFSALKVVLNIEMVLKARELPVLLSGSEYTVLFAYLYDLLKSISSLTQY